MMVQNFYRCATCVTGWICEVCITNCHAGHIIYENEISIGPGVCVCGLVVCGEEGSRGSRGRRSCKMLTGKFIHELYLSFF